MGIVKFNGVTSRSIGLEVESPPDYDIAERIYEITHVPGRNGDVVMDTGAYKNSTRPYKVSIGRDEGNFANLANRVSGWLHSAPGYLRLEDSYTPDYFMLARYGESNSLINILQQAGKATINFDRKPQRFLKKGDIPFKMIGPKTFNNPTNFVSKPLIKIEGNGSGIINFGDYTIKVNNLSSFMYIDSEEEDAYKDKENMNNSIELTNGFPMFKVGNTLVSFSGGITSLTITPRWWTI